MAALPAASLLTTDYVTLAAAVIAAIASVVSVVLAARRERKKLVWAKEVNRFFELEELAGKIVEELGGYRPLPEDRTLLMESFRALEGQAGRFARYTEVRQAVRDLLNVLQRLVHARLNLEDDREERSELEPAYQKLLKTCDAVLGNRKV